MKDNTNTNKNKNAMDKMAEKMENVKDKMTKK